MAIDVTALDSQIVATFTGNSGLVAAFPGGIRADVAPEGAAMPYLIYQVLASPSTTTYGNTDLTETSVRFQAIGVGKTAVGQLMNTLIGVFDNTILTLGNGAVNFDCRRAGRPVPFRWPDVSGASQDVWSWSCEYIYMVRN